MRRERIFAQSATLSPQMQGSAPARRHRHSDDEEEAQPFGADASPAGRVLAMQQIVGNDAVRRFLTNPDGSKTFESPEFQGEGTLEAVLNGKRKLQSGDKGPAVEKVQTALIKDGEEMPKFGADGSYGGETVTAVKQFKAKHQLGSEQFGDVGTGTMGKLDELGSRAGPPNVEPPNVKPEDKIDPILELFMDLTMTNYTRLLREQVNGLVSLERDLSGPETKDTNLLSDLAKSALLAGVQFLLPPGSGLIFKTVVGQLSKAGLGKIAEDFIVKEVVTPVFSAIEGKAKEKINALGDPSSAQGAGQTALQVFMDTQRNALFDATLDAQQSVSFAKTNLRKGMDDDDKTRFGEPGDPRVERQAGLNSTLESKFADAKQQQIDRTTKDWVVYQAQATGSLGQKDALFPDDGVTKKDTDISKLRGKNSGSVPGILEIKIKNLSKNKDVKTPIEVVEARIVGLSDKVRATLNGKGAILVKELQFPRRVMTTNGDVQVGRTEADSSSLPFANDIGSTKDGRQELEALAFDPSGGFAPIAEQGAADVMNKVDAMTLAQIPGKLAGGIA